MSRRLSALRTLFGGLLGLLSEAVVVVAFLVLAIAVAAVALRIL